MVWWILEAVIQELRREGASLKVNGKTPSNGRWTKPTQVYEISCFPLPATIEQKPNICYSCKNCFISSLWALIISLLLDVSHMSSAGIFYTIQIPPVCKNNSHYNNRHHLFTIRALRDLTRSLILSWIEAQSYSALRCPLNSFRGHHANA